MFPAFFACADVLHNFRSVGTKRQKKKGKKWSKSEKDNESEETTEMKIRTGRNKYHLNLDH